MPGMSLVGLRGADRAATSLFEGDSSAVIIDAKSDSYRAGAGERVRVIERRERCRS